MKWFAYTVVVLAIPLFAWLNIEDYPPEWAAIVLSLAVIGGIDGGYMASRLWKITVPNQWRVGIAITAFLLFVGVDLFVTFVDFGCLDPGGAWNWDTLSCQFE